MSRLRDLAPEDLERLPPACRACTFWESATAPRGRSASEAAKIAWWQATQLEWGTPGKAVVVDEVCIGYVVLAPPALVPRSRRLGPAASDDALLLATLWVVPEARRGGVARTLFQATMRSAHQAGARALEAYGSEQDIEEWQCILPAAFLRRLGFTLHRADPSFPLYRVETRHAVAWPALGHALEGVVAALSRRERQALPEPT